MGKDLDSQQHRVEKMAVVAVALSVLLLAAYEGEEDEEAQCDLAVKLSTPVVVGKPAFRDRSSS